MYKIIQGFFLLLTLNILLVNCRKKAFDEYYGRPASLETPIYQQLEAKGNFKMLLAAIDKAGYKNTLGAAGFWTLFAPHDSAFQVYFAAKGIGGIDQLDSATCRQLVTYSLVFNAFNVERLDDYQAATGWVPDAAWKRRTAHYTYVYNGKDTTGKSLKVIAANRNGTFYVESDNNNKYIPFFVDNFMQKNNLSAADYNYFYPTIRYTGFNVVDAIVTERDIPAENGVIHVINKVITALPSIDQYLGSKPEYSLFKSIFDKFLVQYILNPAITQRFRNTTGSTEDVFTKAYAATSGILAYSLNNENHLLSGNDAQTKSYSIFAPTNDVLQAYINNVLLENYPANSTLDILGRESTIILDFINAHLWQEAVWPSKFGSTPSFLGEQPRFDPAIDIMDKQILSNGIFYGTKKVQEANVFTSVYGRAYLDPKYSIMKKLLDWELRSTVSDISRSFTLFMISDSVWNAHGFFADPNQSSTLQDQWRYTPPPPATQEVTSTARNRMLRILNLHVVPHDLPSKVLNSLAGEGAVMTVGGEYIGYKNNTVFSSGNVDSNNVVRITGTKTSKNGRVYYIDRLLTFTPNSIGANIEKLGLPTTSPYNYFWQYLRNSTIWENNVAKDITGIPSGSFYTLFIPNNAAIMNAVKDGLLPGNRTTGQPTFNPTAALEKEVVVRFIYYHFLDKRTIAADGEDNGSGSISTLLKTSLGDPTTIFVRNDVGSIQLTDMNNRTARVISAPTYYLANRMFIHLIDNYLKYTL